MARPWLDKTGSSKSNVGVLYFNTQFKKMSVNKAKFCTFLSRTNYHTKVWLCWSV